MERKKRVFSLIKDLGMRRQIMDIKIDDQIYFARGNQKTQSERDLAWLSVVAAIIKDIPVVFSGNNPTSEYEEYVRQICQKLEIQKDIATILFTSGSTGKPKPLQRSFSRLVEMTKYSAKYTKLKPGMVVSDLKGMSHESGLSMFLRAAYKKCPLIFIDPSWDYCQIVERAIEKKVDYFNASAMQWHGVARALKESNLKWKLKTAIVTSGIIDLETVAILSERTNCEIYCAYAMTEIGIVTYLDPRQVNKKHGSVGKPLPGISIKIMNEKGKECIPFEEGEIVIFSEYLAYPNEPPYYSGDNGYFDEQGYLFLCGRKGDVLKIKGRRVNTMQIEGAYERYSCVVFGISEKMLGNHEAVIVVETSDSIDTVRAYIEKIVPPVSEVCRPRWIFVSEKLPTTSRGKFDRIKIKDIYGKKIEKIKNEEKLINSFEKNIAEIFEEVLYTKGVQPDDSFFALGGKSLRVMTLIANIRRTFQVEITAEQIYKNPTVKKLSKIIHEKCK